MPSTSTVREAEQVQFGKKRQRMHAFCLPYVHLYMICSITTTVPFINFPYIT